MKDLSGHTHTQKHSPMLEELYSNTLARNNKNNVIFVFIMHKIFSDTGQRDASCVERCHCYVMPILAQSSALTSELVLPGWLWFSHSHVTILKCMCPSLSRICPEDTMVAKSSFQAILI